LPQHLFKRRFVVNKGDFMPSNQRLSDLIDYTTVLPYASELFGIYQPLLGWKSQRLADRFQKGFANDKRSILDDLSKHFAAQVEVDYRDDCQVEVRMRPGALARGNIKSFKSLLLKNISRDLPPYENYEPEIWSRLITSEKVEAIIKERVIPEYTTVYQQRCKQLGLSKEVEGSPRLSTISPEIEEAVPRFTVGGPALSPEFKKKVLRNAIDDRLRYESSMAGTILFLTEHHLHQELSKIFYVVKKKLLAGARIGKAIVGTTGPGSLYEFGRSRPPGQGRSQERFAITHQRSTSFPGILFRTGHISRLAREPRLAKSGLDGRDD